METADPFATTAPATGEDPFAEVEAEAAADDGSAVPPAEAPEEPAPPIVDREGQPVEPADAAPAEEPQAAPEQPQEPEEAPGKPEPADQPDGGGDNGNGALTGQEPPEPEPASEDAKTRRYKLLYLTDSNQWTEAPLEKAPQGASEVDERGESWLLARNADHARRLAWQIFERPENGVTVVPVAASSWKPRRVQKAQPQPEKERLEIV